MEVKRTTSSSITHFRTQFLEENNIQFVYDKCHRYGWADVYLFSVDDVNVGYGSVWGREKRTERDTIFEFYLIPDHRHLAEEFFIRFVSTAKTPFIECQSNDRFLYPMFEKFASNVFTEAILFAEHHTTNLIVRDTHLEFKDSPHPDDHAYVLNNKREEVGTGGFMLNYNFPYADIYYDIHESHRRGGLGSYFVQELKKEIYRIGRVPAARCNVTNTASKATLLKAGMVVCGFRINGDIRI